MRNLSAFFPPISSQQPTWRLWGEEREKDAIYTVYLKKVRYHRPTPSASSVSKQILKNKYKKKNKLLSFRPLSNIIEEVFLKITKILEVHLREQPPRAGIKVKLKG